MDALTVRRAAGKRTGPMDSAQRRTDKLIVREVEGETVVYDTASEMVTVLDPETAAVWQAADGQAPIDKIAKDLALPQEKVEVALVRLGDAGLLKTVMSRRTLLRGAGATVAVGGLMTVMAPPAFAAASGVRTIGGTGSCPNNNTTNPKDASVTVTGDGFTVGTVRYTITYNSGPTGSSGTTSVSGTITQSQTGTASGDTIKLLSVRPGTTTATITATDSSGKTATGVVALTRC